jgi:recombination protein RecA
MQIAQQSAQQSARQGAVPWPQTLRRFEERTSSAAWSLDELAGRLVEIRDERSCAALTFAVRLVLEAQRARENAVWITSRASSFYPPDVAEWGIDLDALAVVRMPQSSDIAGAADGLARSGAFGLLVLDLGSADGSPADVPSAVQTRLLGLAQKHDAAIVCLTEKGGERAQNPSPDSLFSLGSLFSLRALASRRACGSGRFECQLEIVKDKRRSPGRRHTEVCRGPHGLCHGLR